MDEEQAERIARGNLIIQRELEEMDARQRRKGEAHWDDSWPILSVVLSCFITSFAVFVAAIAIGSHFGRMDIGGSVGAILFIGTLMVLASAVHRLTGF